MATVHFIYDAAETDQSIRANISDVQLAQDGNILELMPLDLNESSLAKILAEAFSRGVNIGRKNPKLHFETPEQLTPTV